MSANGSEAAAIQILTRAVQLDNENKFSESLTCYEQGIRLLLLALKETSSDEKKIHFNKKVKEYLSRAEIMKLAAQKERDSKDHKQIRIGNNDTGYSYEKVFSSLIDEFLTSVEVEDAYIRSAHQIYNFLHFCELMVKKGNNMKEITLHTTYCNDNVRLNNGWIVKIGRGLDYYKRASGKFSIGYADFDLRPCHETTIDIFHRKSLHKSS